MKPTTLKFGRNPVVRDARTPLMRSLFAGKVFPRVPQSCFVEEGLPIYNVPTPMFSNDRLGCCVVAAKAHQTLRFEDFEQQKLITITEADVKADYYAQTGGADTGLNMLSALNHWRTVGWTIGAGGKDYTIYAFASLMHRKRADRIKAIMCAIRYLRGAYVGVCLPDNWREQFDSRRTWTLDGDRPNPQSGHCIYLRGYQPAGVSCVTWGRLQLMTWDWLIACMEEAYGVLDNRDNFVRNSPVDVSAASKMLKEVEA